MNLKRSGLIVGVVLVAAAIAAPAAWADPDWGGSPGLDATVWGA